MKSTIDSELLHKQSLLFIDLLNHDAFYDAHEALELLWFPIRFEKDSEVLLLKACINASVSFELVRLGREKSGLKPWGFFLKNRCLIEEISTEHLNHYTKMIEAILNTRDRLNCFQL